MADFSNKMKPPVSESTNIPNTDGASDLNLKSKGAAPMAGKRNGRRSGKISAQPEGTDATCHDCGESKRIQAKWYKSCTQCSSCYSKQKRNERKAKKIAEGPVSTAISQDTPEIVEEEDPIHAAVDAMTTPGRICTTQATF
jgi:hypothetical protein